jgi:anoctamin-8
LFSAAFPIGPAIAMLMNIVEIRMKIITYLFVYKKPSAERAPGIGDWLYIWEYMSFIGVFTNFTLLYLKSSTQLHDYYFDKDSIIKQESMLWVFLFLMFLIIMVKYLIQKLIPDKPRWVIEEEEERKAQRKQQSMK